MPRWRLLTRVDRRLPSLLACLLLVFGGTAFAALAVLGTEGLARLRDPGYLIEKRGVHVFSGTYGWVARPGASAMVEGKRVTFNAAGYRGRELALPKTGDRTRVVVLGDSIAFGLGVSNDETFTHLLDVRDNGIEAGSLAVQGYGPGQELLVLQHDGLRYDPDVVVLAFCLTNDFADAVLPVSLYDGRTPTPRFALVGDRLVLDDSGLRQSAAGRAVQWLSDYSYLFNRMSALDSRVGVPPGPHWRYRRREALRDEDYVLRLNLALVRRMRDLCRQRGIAFLVAAFPNGSPYREDTGLANRFIQSLAGEGIAVVDMSAHFRALGLVSTSLALDGVGHLSRVGHSVACGILEKEIAARAGWNPSILADATPARSEPVEWR